MGGGGATRGRDPARFCVLCFAGVLEVASFALASARSAAES